MTPLLLFMSHHGQAVAGCRERSDSCEKTEVCGMADRASFRPQLPGISAADDGGNSHEDDLVESEDSAPLASWVR
jgi:hypothetical protein